MPAFTVPDPVLDVLARLKHQQHRAAIVGGAIRDHWLGRTIRDWDIATDADADALMVSFPRAVPIGLGRGHGTVMVPTAAGPVDITPFREGRLEEDLAHRDFTVNAIAWDLDEGFIDPTGGREDLEAAKLRCPGRAADRLQEDPLRALRAARLVAALGFELDSEVEAALPACARPLGRVAAERVRAELDALVEGPFRADAIRLLKRTGLEASLIAGARDDAAELLAELPLRRDLGLAGWLLETQSARALGRWRFPKVRARQIERVLNLHPIDEAFHGDTGARRLRAKAGDDATLADAIALCRGVRSLHGADDAPLAAIEAALERTRSNAVTVGDLALSGEDVMRELGVGPGREVGRALRSLLEHVLEDASANEPERLRRILRELK